MDDVLVFGSNQRQPDDRLTAALKHTESRQVWVHMQETRLPRACINQSGVQADPEKTTLAIQVMKSPTNISEMNRLLGMANQLGKFTPKLAELMNHYVYWSSKTVPGSIRIS